MTDIFVVLSLNGRRSWYMEMNVSNLNLLDGEDRCQKKRKEFACGEIRIMLTIRNNQTLLSH